MGGGPRYADSYERGPRTLRTVCGDEGTGHRIHMRGLPFRATEEDIADVRMSHGLSGRIGDWFIYLLFSLTVLPTFASRKHPHRLRTGTGLGRSGCRIQHARRCTPGHGQSKLLFFHSWLCVLHFIEFPCWMCRMQILTGSSLYDTLLAHFLTFFFPMIIAGQVQHAAPLHWALPEFDCGTDRLRIRWRLQRLTISTNDFFSTFITYPNS